MLRSLNSSADKQNLRIKKHSQLLERSEEFLVALLQALCCVSKRCLGIVRLNNESRHADQWVVHVVSSDLDSFVVPKLLLERIAERVVNTSEFKDEVFLAAFDNRDFHNIERTAGGL